jgi:hypothetical protein
MKKYHWHAFRHEKLFEKQPLPHCQALSYTILEGSCGIKTSPIHWFIIIIIINIIIIII